MKRKPKIEPKDEAQERELVQAERELLHYARMLEKMTEKAKSEHKKAKRNET